MKKAIQKAVISILVSIFIMLIIPFIIVELARPKDNASSTEPIAPTQAVETESTPV